MNAYKVNACGLTKNNRPNVVLEDLETGEIKPVWYHTTFYKVDVALDFIKETYQTGATQDDLDDGLWITLQELQKMGD